MDDQLVQQPHVVIFPFPTQGHIKPLLCLGEFLSQAGLHVTFVNTHQNHRRLADTGALSSLGRIPNFHLVSISDGLPDDFLRWPNYNYISGIKSATKPHLKELLHLINSGDSSPPVTCLIYDGLMSFPIEVAEELKIPALSFYPCNPRYVWSIFNLPNLVEKGELPFADEDDMNEEIFNGVPGGLEGLLRRDDLPLFFTSKHSHPRLQFFIDEHLAMLRASGLILNAAFDDVSLPHLGHLFGKLYTVGPLHVVAGATSDRSNSSLWKEEESCLAWLDSQPSKSVLYVNFGSTIQITHHQLLEFWHALINSGYPFLLVVRPDLMQQEERKLGDGDHGNVIPQELVMGPTKTGYVVAWAPQERVLGHNAVAGYLFHCGWNSVLESIMARVPLICRPPKHADCTVTSRVVSKEWRIGLELEATDRWTIERTIKKFLETQRVEFERSIDGIYKLATDSVGPGGSSYHSLEILIQDIRKMQQKGE